MWLSPRVRRTAFSLRLAFRERHGGAPTPPHPSPAPPPLCEVLGKARVLRKRQLKRVASEAALLARLGTRPHPRVLRPFGARDGYSLCSVWCGRPILTRRAIRSRCVLRLFGRAFMDADAVFLVTEVGVARCNVT